MNPPGRPRNPSAHRAASKLTASWSGNSEPATHAVPQGANLNNATALCGQTELVVHGDDAHFDPDSPFACKRCLKKIALASPEKTESTVRIPRRFYEDHVWRGLPAPPVLRETKRHIWIDPGHPDTPELLSDARHHASEAMYMDPPMPGLASSARATVRALTAEKTS